MAFQRSRSPRAKQHPSDCLVVWLDDVRYFLQDMGLTTQFKIPSLKRRTDYATALPWLLRVASAKSASLLGGFDSITTGEEDVRSLPHDVVSGVEECSRFVSSPTLGYMQPPAVAVFEHPCPKPDFLETLNRLTHLRFHCGGQIVVLSVATCPPPLRSFVLDGSCGWSCSCHHKQPCDCPRAPVNPWAEWSTLAWQAYNDQVGEIWRFNSVFGCEVVVHNVIVAIFQETSEGFYLLKLWREASPGGHFTGWSVPGGKIERGKDFDVWDAARREWSEEMVGYPWEDVVDENNACASIDVVRDCHLYRRGDWTLCVDSVSEMYLADQRIGGNLRHAGANPKSTATLFIPAKQTFYEETCDGPLKLRAPENSVTKQTLKRDGRKIHTDGWLFLEHCGEAWWTRWDAHADEYMDGFPSARSYARVLPALQEIYGWY